MIKMVKFPDLLKNFHKSLILTELPISLKIPEFPSCQTIFKSPTKKFTCFYLFYPSRNEGPSFSMRVVLTSHTMYSKATYKQHTVNQIYKPVYELAVPQSPRSRKRTGVVLDRPEHALPHLDVVRLQRLGPLGGCGCFRVVGGVELLGLRRLDAEVGVGEAVNVHLVVAVL